MRGIDVSNYTGELSQATLAAWRGQHDVGLVIAQSLQPPAGYPPGVTRQQVQAVTDAGIACDIYLWLWTGSNVEQDMRNKLAVVNGQEHLIRKVWLDVEDTSASTPGQRINAVRQAFAVIDGWTVTHEKPAAGLYSALWYWPSYMDNTPEFSGRELWDADYDGIEDTESSWRPYGGWSTRAIKQYAGTSTLAGQGGIDLNVLSAAEAASIAAPTPPPEEPAVPCEDQAWQDKKWTVVEAAGQLLAIADMMEAEANRPPGPRKTVIRKLATEVRERAQTILG
jgi:hypothetical protein